MFGRRARLWAAGLQGEGAAVGDPEAPAQQEVAGGVELVDPAVVEVGDVDLTTRVAHGNAHGGFDPAGVLASFGDRGGRCLRSAGGQEEGRESERQGKAPPVGLGDVSIAL